MIPKNPDALLDLDLVHGQGREAEEKGKENMAVSALDHPTTVEGMIVTMMTGSAVVGVAEKSHLGTAGIVMTIDLADLRKTARLARKVK